MKLKKSIITYLLFTIGIFLFAKIYTVFGHGVTSHWMSNAYQYLCGLGVFVFSLFQLVIPDIVNREGYWLFYHVYSSGIAILINGMLLYGIIEIAGSASNYVSWFLYVGYGLIAIAVLLFMKMMIRKPFLQHN